MAWNLYRAIDSSVTYAKEASLTKDFGLLPEKAEKPSVQVGLDIVLILSCMVTGVFWNKGQDNPI